MDALQRGLKRVECAQAAAEGRGLARIACSEVDERRRELFDLAVAHELYSTLIGPVEALVKDKHHLLVVPSGALTALPFHLLVTEKPAVAVPQIKTPHDLAAYRDAAWLLKRHAVSVLPSVTSLKALRVLARKDLASKPLIGFGDPSLVPKPGRRRPRTPLRRERSSRVPTPIIGRVRGIDRNKLGTSPAAATGHRRRT